MTVVAVMMAGRVDEAAAACAEAAKASAGFDANALTNDKPAAAPAPAPKPFRTLPPPEYIYQFHPEYEQYGPDYASTVYSPEYMKQFEGVIDIRFGSNLLFWIFEKTPGISHLLWIG